MISKNTNKNMIENIEREKRSIRVFDLVLILLVTLAGALFFLCITRSIEGFSIANPWISAMVCATIFEVFLSLFAITIGRKKLIIPIVIIAFLPSVIFMPVIWHMIFVIIAIFIAIKGLYVMRATLFNMLKIDISTIIRSGITYISIALVIVITSQYYFFIRDNTETVFDAKHYIGVSNIIIDYIAKKSGAQNVSISAMTVDDFLKFMMENIYKQKQSQEDIQNLATNQQEEGMLVRWVGQSGINVEKIKDKVQTQALEQMRINMSKMINHNLDGSEMISDVFSEIISTRIDEIMAQNAFLRENRAKVFTAIFFLIIFSLASIVRFVSGFSTRFIFMLFREFKIVHVIKTKRDAEVIVL